MKNLKPPASADLQIRASIQRHGLHISSRVYKQISHYVRNDTPKKKLDTVIPWRSEESQTSKPQNISYQYFLLILKPMIRCHAIAKLNQ